MYAQQSGKGKTPMYIIKNALRCIGRAKGRNILIGIIVLVIATSACIGLSIRQAAENAKNDILSSVNVTATISFDRTSIRYKAACEAEPHMPLCLHFERGCRQAAPLILL